MKYQLVLQWATTSEDDYDRLITIEGTIENGLGGAGILDGHDIGSGEMNIFIHTDDPKSAFEKAKELLKPGNYVPKMTAGYRDFGEDDYTPLYPLGLDHFSVK